MTASKWLHTKQSVRSRQGIITARHPLAAAAGASVLHEGGNALDAAIAGILATGVAHPFATGLGGGGLLTICQPGQPAVTLDYRSEASRSATCGSYEVLADLQQGILGWQGVKDRENELGPRSVAVPGTVPGLISAHGKYGRMPWGTVVSPAIYLAESGYETDWYMTLMQSSYLNLLTQYPLTARTFLRGGTYPYRPTMLNSGDIFIQATLARTLRDLAEGQIDAYINGTLGASISEAASTSIGGLIDTQDVEAYEPRWANAPVIQFRGFKVMGPAHGGLYELLFSVLDMLPTHLYPPLSAQRLHLIIEVLRRCRQIERVHFGDRARDTGLAGIERVRSLNPKANLAHEVFQSIDAAKCKHDWRDAWWAVAEEHGAGGNTPGQEQTAHVCAMDKDGMTVSLTETVLSPFGSMVTTSAGVLLNNAMFAFVPLPGHPNSIQPCSRPHSNMSPLVLRNSDDRPVLTAGASGGKWISAAVMQIVAYCCDFGMNAQSAVSMPRLDVHDEATLTDSAVPADTIDDLRRRGHSIVPVTRTLSSLYFANPSAISMDDEGNLTAGLDPMSFTSAAGL
jgi:gamma-glutamyltranspeptidase / glutathione hydrolase